MGLQNLLYLFKQSVLFHFLNIQSKNSECSGTLYLEATDNGWWYSLPNSYGNRFVGYCVDLNSFKNRKLPLREFYVKELNNTELIKNQLNVSPKIEGIFGQTVDIQRSHDICGPSWIYLGDAAFSSNPLSGGGIEFAINSGKLAASVIANNDLKSMNMYKAWVKDYSIQHNKILKFYLKIANVK